LLRAGFSAVGAGPRCPARVSTEHIWVPRSREEAMCFGPLFFRFQLCALLPSQACYFSYLDQVLLKQIDFSDRV
jgi:hypothetical protein